MSLLQEPSSSTAFVSVEDTDGVANSPEGKTLARRTLERAGSVCEWAFGLVALVLGLAVLASVPVLQLLCFGYLLEAGGRIARSGRLRDAWIGVRRCARVGSMSIGAVLLFLPLQLVASWASSAELIDPGGIIARRWRWGLVAITLAVVVHLIAACARGGRIRDLLWPLAAPAGLRQIARQGTGSSYRAARDAVWVFVQELRLPYYLRLGFLGFVGTMAWLVVPVSLLALGRRFPVVGWLGGLLLALVAGTLPLLQIQFAIENKLAALFDLKRVRQHFARAPWAFACAGLITLGLALPLYLLKIERIPRETVWLASLVFLLFIFPARALTGWAYARSLRREQPRHAFSRWTGRMLLFTAGIAYALIVFATQLATWHGLYSLYEQHAFLLPVPFTHL